MPAMTERSASGLVLPAIPLLLIAADVGRDDDPIG